MSTIATLTKEEKRSIIFGIALSHVLVPSIRPALEQGILAEYNNLKSIHSIDVQLKGSVLAEYPAGNALKYQNINANDTKLNTKSSTPSKKYDHNKFDYRVTSHVDLAKLFLQNHMAKFTAFNETCDASAVLNLLGNIPKFPPALQNAANVVREGRNAWAHCNFIQWNQANFERRFGDMQNLLQKFSLPAADEKKVREELDVWKIIADSWCERDATLEVVKFVHHRVSELSTDLENMSFESEEKKNRFKEMLENAGRCLKEEEKKAEQKKAEQKKAEQKKAEQKKAEQKKAEQKKAEQKKAEQKKGEHRSGLLPWPPFLSLGLNIAVGIAGAMAGVAAVLSFATITAVTTNIRRNQMR